MDVGGGCMTVVYGLLGTAPRMKRRRRSWRYCSMASCMRSLSSAVGSVVRLLKKGKKVVIIEHHADYSGRPHLVGG